MVLETTEAWIELLAAYLMFGRFRQRRQAGDLLLVYALALFGFTNLFLSALPGALVGAPRQGFSAWAPLATRFIGVVACAGSAYLPDRRLPDPRRAGVQVSVAVAATLTLAAVLVVVFGPHLPATTDPRLSPEASARPRIVGHPVVLGAQLFATRLSAPPQPAFCGGRPAATTS